MDKLEIQEANAVQRTPCIPEQIADHQENVIITCEDKRNDVVTFLFRSFSWLNFIPVLAVVPLILLLRPLFLFRCRHVLFKNDLKSYYYNYTTVL